MDELINYKNDVIVIKEAILRSQYRAVSTVNSEQLSLYYGIGQYVSQNSRKGFWGTSAIAQIATMLHKELPGLRGFSAANIKKMRVFFEEWHPVINRSFEMSEINSSENKEALNRSLSMSDLKVNDDLLLFEDSLSEMVLFSGVGKEIYHELLQYIDSFNPELAQWYRDNDIEMSGVYDDMIEEAAHLAKAFHQGQKDKAGVDYFEGHLSYVGNAGDNWKEKIVGFLHDVAEDTPHTVEEIMHLLKAKSNGVLTNEDAQEIKTALNLLNSSTASSREDYIARIKDSFLATKVKLNDLRHNMDLSRIHNPTPKDMDRLARYKKEYGQILEYL